MAPPPNEKNMPWRSKGAGAAKREGGQEKKEKGGKWARNAVHLSPPGGSYAAWRSVCIYYIPPVRTAVWEKGPTLGGTFPVAPLLSGCRPPRKTGTVERLVTRLLGDFQARGLPINGGMMPLEKVGYRRLCNREWKQASEPVGSSPVVTMPTAGGCKPKAVLWSLTSPDQGSHKSHDPSVGWISLRQSWTFPCFNDARNGRTRS